jgi:hypothetical protein
MTPIRPHLGVASLFAVVAAVTPVSAQETPSPQTCVAVMLPSVQGAEGSATAVASAVRDLFVSYLTGPSIRSIPLESRLASQAALEAGQKGCGYVLIPSVMKKRSGGGTLGGALGQAAGTAAWYVPYGGAAGGIGRAAAIGAAQTMSGFAGETRRKDEITLGYRVGTPETVVNAAPVSNKAKAKVDGEDLLTPLVERAAQDVFAAATRR